MYEASFQGLIRTILIFIVVYYAFKIAIRFLMPYLAKKMVQKAEKQFREAQGFNPYQQANQTQNNAKSPKKDAKKVGEYIDFEEID